jgi:hypothetical protein
MGFRTVVMLYNDQAGNWENDPNLGKKIARSTNFALGFGEKDRQTDLGYGHVVLCEHADAQTIGVFDSYRFVTIAAGAWRRDEPTGAMSVRMVKEAADRLGYRLVKKRSA